MTQAAPTTEQAIDEQPWPEHVHPPPVDLPYDDGEPLESSWHVGNGPLLKASYIAARSGVMNDYYVGVNMFVYYSWQQVRNQDYKGPDVYIVKNVDGARRRLYWAIWDEDGRYPDVIIEFLSVSTEREDLGAKKRIYEQIFHTAEYFCVASEVERLMGWRLERHGYTQIVPDERGWLWSEELGLWLGPWHGVFLGEEHTWARYYHPDGQLVLLPEEAERQRAEAASHQAETERQRAEAERQRAEAASHQAETERQRAEAERQRAEAASHQAETERQRAEDLFAQMAALQAELKRLHGEGD